MAAGCAGRVSGYEDVVVAERRAEHGYSRTLRSMRRAWWAESRLHTSATFRGDDYGCLLNRLIEVDRVALNAVVGASRRGQRHSTNDHDSAVGRVFDPLGGKRVHPGLQSRLSSTMRLAVRRGSPIEARGCVTATAAGVGCSRVYDPRASHSRGLCAGALRYCSSDAREPCAWCSAGGALPACESPTALTRLRSRSGRRW